MNLKLKKSLIISVLAIVVAVSVISIQIIYAASPDAPLSMYEEYKEDPLLFAEIYAKQHGVTVNEAFHRFELQDLAGELDAEISSKEVETFAGLWIEHTPKFKVVVLFTRNAEETIEPYIQKYRDLAELIEVRTVEMSLLNLQNIQNEVSSSATSLGIPVASEIDVYTNHVKIYVIDRARFDDAIVDGKLRVPACVDVVTVESLGTLDTDIYGGLALTTCTSGFAVKTAGGTKGITTAGHIVSEQSYGGHNLPFQDEEYGTSYDIQWHTAPDFTVVNDIQWYTGYVCDITSTKSRSDQSIGGWVAKYGKTTEFTAGHISSKTYQPAGLSATFIRVDNDGGYDDLSQGGDSGGPWFNNHTAYGSHCGSVAGDMDDAYYMAIDYVSILGVSVMTSP